jgi:hypothetical protein
MKKQILILCICFLINNAIFCQLRLLDKSEFSISIEYYNDSDKVAYFSNPSFYLKQKHNKKGVSYYIRNDMFDYSNETLYLYFTDTTLTQYKQLYKVIDSFHRIIGLSVIDTLPPKTFLRFKINFKNKINCKHIALKYNFGYKKEEFFNSYGIPVKELVL